jgi:hypothetical protein
MATRYPSQLTVVPVLLGRVLCGFALAERSRLRESIDRHAIAKNP